MRYTTIARSGARLLFLAGIVAVLLWAGRLGVGAADPPTITDLAPDSGPIAGGVLITITGTDLTGATEVTFDGAPASFTVQNDSAITATTPGTSRARSMSPSPPRTA